MPGRCKRDYTRLRGRPRPPTRGGHGTPRPATGRRRSAAERRELAALVGQDGGEQLALGAFVAQQRGPDLVARTAACSSTSFSGMSSSASATENRPTVKRPRAPRRALPPRISHMRARWSAARRARRERRDRRSPSPSPSGGRCGAEQRQRLADRLDGAREREERRVDVAQQLERQADVGADRRSRSSKEASGAVTSASARSEAEAAGADRRGA